MSSSSGSLAEASALSFPNLQSTIFTNITLDMNNNNISSRNSSSNNTNFTSTLHPAMFLPCDNPRNVISPAVAEMVDLVVYVGICPVLVTCGVIANVINTTVFARQGLSDRIHLCLFSLAVSDTCLLLFLMAGKSYALISLVDPLSGSYWQQRHNGPMLGNYLAFLAISNTITALIAMERCMCVISPLKAARFFKAKYMRTAIMVLAVYVLVLENVSLSFKYQTVPVTHPLTNATITYISRLSPFYLRHRTLIDIFYMYMLTVSIPFLSLLVVNVCTAAIVLRLRVAADWRHRSSSSSSSVAGDGMTSSSSSSDKQEVAVVRMLVTVCSVFMVCTIPTFAKEVLLFVRLPGFLSTGHLCNVFKVTVAGTRTLEALNASINFCIYIKQSSRYRTTFRQLCRCCSRRCGSRWNRQRRRELQQQQRQHEEDGHSSCKPGSTTTL